MSIATQQELWTPGVHAEPGITQPLMNALTVDGRQHLLRELRDAIANADSPEAVLQVVEAWWITLRSRNNPAYHRRMKDPGPERVYPLEEFLDKLGR